MTWPGGHSPKSGKCHPLKGKHVVVVDVKQRSFMGCIGRTGIIHHDPTFDHDYLAFDDGGSADPFTEVIVDELVDRHAHEAAIRDGFEQDYLNDAASGRPSEGDER